MTLRNIAVKVVTALRVQCSSPLFQLGFSLLLLRSMSSGKRRCVEALWRDFFSDTSQWWDHRPEKTNPRFPDFKHKQTGEALWLADARNPAWVQAELDTIPPGTLQSNIFSWTQRLKRYVKAGQYRKTIGLFHQMQLEGICPDSRTFLPVLNACAGLGALEKGKHVHKQIIHADCESDVYVATCLVDMYAKCGSIGEALSVFNKMCKHDVVSWNAMIGGYVKAGQWFNAMELFRKMQLEEVAPDAVTFVGVLNACASVSALEEGRRVHEQVILTGCETDVYVATCLVDLYSKCGSIRDAWTVFIKMRERSTVSWNAMIGGYVKSGQGLKAMELFRRMQLAGVEPDLVTFVGVLNACASMGALEEGRHVHEQIIQHGCESDVYVANCLVDMYAKCGSIKGAWSVLNKIMADDVVSWNAMIGGYVKSGQGLKAMEVFKKVQREGLEPDAVTFVGVLNACARVANLEEGRHIHEQMIERGCQSDVYVATCLVDMYAKCGSIEDAQSVFHMMPEHNVASWNAMIAGYVKCGQGLKAMQLYRKMQLEGVEPDTVTVVGVLNACASVCALEEGRRVHDKIIQRGSECDVYTAACLVDMYAKCGSIDEAWSVFKKIGEYNVVSCNAMIGGYAMHGDAEKAIALYRRMSKEDVEINRITFTCLLSACSHRGLVKEGLRYFKSMMSCFHIFPSTEQYACMVDLLGRAGQLKEAEEMTERMPLESNVCVWMSLLGACKIHGNIEVAERAAKWCWELDPHNASGHILLSNIYATAGKLDRSAATVEERLGGKVWKDPGRTWVELNNVVHSFVVNDKEHPQILKIHSELERLSGQMNE